MILAFVRIRIQYTKKVESYLLGKFLAFITLGAICRMKEIFFFLIKVHKTWIPKKVRYGRKPQIKWPLLPVILYNCFKLVLLFQLVELVLKCTSYLTNVSFRYRWKIMTLSQDALRGKWNLLGNHFPDQSSLSIKTRLNCPPWACC